MVGLNGITGWLKRLWRREVAGWQRGYWLRQSMARVDPSAFDPDEFPVVCLECGYELRGSEAGRCSECGTAYERGRLLLELYLNGRRVRSCRSWWWGLRLICLAVLLVFLPPLLIMAFIEFVNSFPCDQRLVVLTWMDPYQYVSTLWTLALLGFGVALASAAIGVYLITRPAVPGRRAAARRVRAWLQVNRPWEAAPRRAPALEGTHHVKEMRYAGCPIASAVGSR